MNARRSRFSWMLLPLAAATLGFGCDPASGPGGDDDTTSDDDAADDDDAIGVVWDVTTEVSETISTLVHVSWTVSVPDAQEPSVEVGIAGLDRRITGKVDGDGFRATILGLKPATEYDLRPSVVVGEVTLLGPTSSVETGPEPPWLPEVTMSIPSPEAVFDGYLVAALVGPTPFAGILDRDGDWVWWARVGEMGAVGARALLSVDEASLLFLAFTPDPLDAEDGPVRIQLDGSGGQALGVTGESHHDMQELPDGTVAVFLHDVREMDDEQVEGHSLVEIAPDGTQTEVWNMWDEPTYRPEDPSTVKGQWGHPNALVYEESDDSYFISLRNFGAIDQIDRATGEVLASIGGSRSDFVGEDGSTSLFTGLHGFEMLETGVVAFENWAHGENHSAVVEYSLDWDSGDAALEWEYVADPLLLCPTYGDVLTLPDGDRLAVWSTASQIDQVTPDGEVVWQLNLSITSAFGYVEWVPDLPSP